MVGIGRQELKRSVKREKLNRLLNLDAPFVKVEVDQEAWDAFESIPDKAYNIRDSQSYIDSLSSHMTLVKIEDPESSYSTYHWLSGELTIPVIYNSNTYYTREEELTPVEHTRYKAYMRSRQPIEPDITEDLTEAVSKLQTQYKK